MQTINFNYLDIQPGNRILDLGCGEGRHSIGVYLLHKHGDVIGVDVCHEDIKTAASRFREFAEADPAEPVKKNFFLSVADGHKLPFPDDSFDRVICSEVLEHISDYHSMLREIDRVLKPDGLLAVSVPRAWPERICWALSKAYHSVKGGHVRIFNARTLKKDIETFDLCKFRHHWAHALHVPYWWLRCLFWHNERAFPVTLYHRLLVWDLMNKPALTRILESILNPVMGKSVVMYFRRSKLT